MYVLVFLTTPTLANYALEATVYAWRVGLFEGGVKSAKKVGSLILIQKNSATVLF